MTALVALACITRPTGARASEGADLSPEQTAAISQRVTESQALLARLEAGGKRLPKAERVKLLQALYGARPAAFAAAGRAASVPEVLEAIRRPEREGREATLSDGVAAPAAIGDVAGSFVFVPITPCRLLDTRMGPGTKIPANFAFGVNIDGGNPGNATGCTLSATGAGAQFADVSRLAYALNVTVVAPSAPGFLSVRPIGATNTTSTLNFNTSEVVANGAIVQDVGSAGNEFELFANVSTHAIVDVLGVFGPPKSKELSCQTVVGSKVTNGPGFYSFSSPSCPTGTTMTGGGFRTDYSTAEIWAYNAWPVTSANKYECTFRTQFSGPWDDYRCYAICCSNP